MRFRIPTGVALLCLIAVALPSRADDAKAAKPAVVLRIRPLGEILEDVKYLGKVVGKEEEAGQLEGIIKAKTGPKGLEGLDLKRPIGMYADLKGASGTESTAVALIPVSDEEAFLNLLANVNFKADKEKDKDGIYTVQGPVPVPVFLAFANKYAYVTVMSKDPLSKDKLLAPTAVFASGPAPLAGLTIALDQIPADLKKMAIAQMERTVAEGKKARPGETEQQAALRAKGAEMMTRHVVEVMQEGGTIEVAADLNRQTEELALFASFSGKPGSSLARGIADIGQAKSLFGGLIGGDSAVSAAAHLAVPESIRKIIEPAIDEGIKAGLEKEKDPGKKHLAKIVADALTPTLKAGELDLALDLRGPSGSKKYTAVGGIKVRDGAGIEKAMKDVSKDLPAKDKDKVKFDADKVGDVNIHELDVSGDMDAEGKALFGENPVYLAFRSDAALFALGENGLAALKAAIALEPKTGKPLAVDVATARIAPLMVKDNPQAPEVAEKAFAGKKGTDKISFTVEGGKALTVKFAMKAETLKFFMMLDEAKKAGK